MSFARPRGLYVKRERRSLLAAPDDSPTTPTHPRPPGAPSAIDLVVRGRIGRADGTALCERARVLLDGRDAGLVVCDVGALTDADLATVDALARLQLTARRVGSKVWLRHASSELRELLALVGLVGAIPCRAGLRLETRRQPEDGEEPRRVEEEGDPADPTG
jgi:ABC-type transporter Mla MlaB component